MKRINIYDRRFGRNEHQILDIEITGEGDLLFEGVDLGDSVVEYWGDFDYEYWLSVKGDQFPELILQLIKECFEKGIFKNDSEFRDWLDEKGIPSSFSSWV
jgi:hypothetical protein